MAAGTLVAELRGPGAETDQVCTLSDSVRAFLHYLRDYRGSPENTLRAYACDLRGLVVFLQTHHPAISTPPQVTREVLMDWALSLGPMGPRSVRRKVACISSLFGFLQDTGRVQGNPARRLPLPNLPRPVPRVLTPEEARRLVAAATTPCARCLVVVMLTTGIRRGEAAQIRLPDVDLTRGLLLVRGKGAKERIIPLCPQAVRAIREYLPWRPETGSPHLWVNERGRSLTEKAINVLVSSLARRTDLPGVTPHKLRHTFATELIRSGTDIRTVQELLGHADMQSTAVYLHSDMTLKGRAVAKLPKLAA